jgi:hypothetical protein
VAPHRKIGGSCFIALLLGSLAPFAALAFGEPDPTFVSTVIPRGNCGTSLSRPDGTLLVPVEFVTITGNVAGPPTDRVAMIRAIGGLDPSWSGQGLGQVLARAPSVVDIRRTVLALPDGSVLLMGDHVSRIDPTGSVDAAYEQNQLADPITVLASPALRDDGGVVALAWHVRMDAYTGPVSTQALTAIRPDGTRDAAFGNGGYVDIGPDALGPVAWSVYADNTVQATVMTVDNTGQPHLTLRRFPTDFDASTPTPGILPIHGTASWVSPLLSVDGDGRVYAIRGVDSSASTSQQAGLALYRFTASGAVDGAFAANGHSFAPLFPHFATSSVFVQPSALWRTATGGFEVVFDVTSKVPGVAYVPFTALALARLLPDGSADTSFGQPMTLEATGAGVVTRLVDGRLAYALSSVDVRDCTVKRVLGDTPAEGTMVEYYKASIDHYFMTLEGAESVLLDETPAGAGWKRTGRAFGAWTPSQLDRTKRLCRFYGDLKGGPDSHFYTPEGAECDGLRALDASTPPGQYAWRFEGYAGNVAVPVDGNCAANLTPVYRLYNRGFEKGAAPNHRYTTDTALYAEMQAKGWAGEGVAFCVPPNPNNVSAS